MRTTLTLDDDVWVLIERLREQRGGTLKDAVNEALRLGLASVDAPPRPRSAYRTQSVSLGRCLVESVNDVAGVLAVSEGERFR